MDMDMAVWEDVEYHCLNRPFRKSSLPLHFLDLGNDFHRSVPPWAIDTSSGLVCLDAERAGLLVS